VQCCVRPSVYPSLLSFLLSNKKEHTALPIRSSSPSSHNFSVVLDPSPRHLCYWLKSYTHPFPTHFRYHHLVVGTLNITPVANKLHLADALANSEETKNLAEDNGRCSPLLLASVADGLRLWEVLAWVLDDGLEVLLEGGDVSVN
jgi:hypothetical protein